MLAILSAKRWAIAVGCALLIMLAMLLPVAAQGGPGAGASCYYLGVWYPHGTIIQGGPVHQVCNNGRWIVIVFEQWGLIQRIDPKLLEKFKTVPTIPDPKPWCLSCPPTLTAKFDSKTNQLLEQEMLKVTESLKNIQLILDNVPDYRP